MQIICIPISIFLGVTLFFVCAYNVYERIYDTENNMELIVIDEDRMKIMLSREELSSYNIDAVNIDTEDESTKRILYDIIDRAKRTAGFEGEYGRMFVRVFASSDGGCEMYVTKYSQLYDDEESVIEEHSQPNHARYSKRKRRYVYKLNSAMELVRACSALLARGYSQPSDAYISESGNVYFLVLSEGECDTTVMLEFSEPESFPGVLLYLCEHARMLCERDAVAHLGAIFQSTDI